ncbi:MAG: hypothetical protein JSV52_03150 [Candidatus Zixiibacteriota bacterium]|nr:MAG: hypothetical protein JSV52_03150 [candidate division Zixibacteria bacterium]
MIVWDEKAESFWKKVNLTAFVALVASPIVYAVIGYVVDVTPKGGGELDMMLYILLIIAVIQPAFARVIERFQIDAYRKNQQTKMTLEQLYFNLAIIRIAFVDAIYLYGLLQVFLSAETIRMLYFYPIGIVWTFIYWPRKSGYEEFVIRMESNVPVI